MAASKAPLQECPAQAAPACTACPGPDRPWNTRRHGDIEATEDFLAVGRDVNGVDADQRTALHYAVAYQHQGVVDVLLASGAKINAMVSLRLGRLCSEAL